MVRALAIGAGLALDRLLGEPPARCHPVAGFGRAMTAGERLVWADQRAVGAAYAGIGAGVAALTGAVLRGRQPTRSRRAIVLCACTYVAVAPRALTEAARHVAGAVEAGDLPEARERLKALVGRRTDDLDEKEIARAVVESVAENTVDAVVAPVFWAAVAGAPGVLVYRAVNTLDAMVGHHTSRYERFGWASARADDLANWLPARLAAVLVAAARPRRCAAIWTAVRNQAPAHPSPNAGVVEAAFAAALGVRLGGHNDYR
ncbi:MAG: cobalamin biosynthesis protein CobD, partial [Acidimicrobiales bacterium]|nr:cobalamin biosynthesis protein CobD [Acidimicrobiales bacterium]